MNQFNYKKTPENVPFISNRADPYVTRHDDGTYYFTASVPEYDRIILRKSDSLMGLREAPEKTVWKKHESGEMSAHIWAPELHRIGDAWYLYFAAGAAEDVWAIRPYVLECRAEDPMEGPWRELGMMEAADEFSFQDFSLDMTVFASHGAWYCVWAEKVSVGKKISNLYIARMKSPHSLATKQVLLSSPDYDWERVDFWVNEGPAVIRRNGRICMTYSASATGAEYCMGLLSAEEDSDLLDPASWTKERLPVLVTDETAGLYGPGHNSFTVDENGRDIMVFHARQYDEITGDPLYDPNRHAYLACVEWEDGEMVFKPMRL